MPIEFKGLPPKCVNTPSFEWGIPDALRVRKMYVEDPRNHAILKGFVGGILRKRQRNDLQAEDVLTDHFVLPQPSKKSMTCLLAEAAGTEAAAPHAQAMEIPDDERFGRGRKISVMKPPEKARLRFYLLPRNCVREALPNTHEDEPSTWWVSIVARFRPDRYVRPSNLHHIPQDAAADALEEDLEEFGEDSPDLEHLATYTHRPWEGWLLCYVAEKARTYGLRKPIRKGEDEDDEDDWSFVSGLETSSEAYQGTSPAAPEGIVADLEPLRWITAFLPSYLCCIESLRDQGMKLNLVVRLFALGTEDYDLPVNQAKQAKRVLGRRFRDLAAALGYIHDPATHSCFNELQAKVMDGSDARRAYDYLMRFSQPEKPAELAADEAQLEAWKQQVRTHFAAYAPAHIQEGLVKLCGKTTGVVSVLAVLSENELGRLRLRRWCPDLPAFPTSWQSARHQAWHGLGDMQRQNLLERSLPRVLAGCQQQCPKTNPLQLLATSITTAPDHE